jgi:hypothetical protein
MTIFKKLQALYQIIDPDTTLTEKDLQIITKLFEFLKFQEALPPPALIASEPPATEVEPAIVGGPQEKFALHSAEWEEAYLQSCKTPPNLITRDAHLKHLKDVSHWKEWIYERPNILNYVRTRAVYLLKIIPFTQGLSEVEAQETEQIHRDLMKNLKEGKVEHMGLKNPADKFALVRKNTEDLRSGQKTYDRWSLFGYLLPPRRNEVSSLEIHSSRETLTPESKNYYLKNESLLHFSEYKTDKTYGAQSYNLKDPEAFPYLTAEVLEQVTSILDGAPSGLLFEACNYSCKYARLWGHSTTVMRSFWSSAMGIDSSQTVKYLALCQWLAHSPETNLIMYKKNEESHAA